MRCNDVQLEWRIADVESKVNEVHSRLYELDSLRSTVDSMERTMRESCSIIDELRYELQGAQEEMRELHIIVSALTE